jgi:hypothetical protein
MLTCKSPRKVMRVAWSLARGVLPDYFSKFSRHDFTVPQLFACLVVKEQQRKTYRDIRSAAARCAALVPRHRHEEGSGPQHPLPRVSRVEPHPAQRQAAGQAGAVVRRRQAIGFDRRAGLQPVRAALPQPPLRAALPALRFIVVAKRLGKREAKSHGAAMPQAGHRRVHAVAPDPLGPGADRLRIRLPRLRALAVRRVATPPAATHGGRRRRLRLRGQSPPRAARRGRAIAESRPASASRANDRRAGIIDA